MKLHRQLVWFCAALLLVPSFVLAQQPAPKATPATALARPDARDRLIVASVAEILKEAHLTRKKIDKEISTRMHRLFIEHWDPRKLFFLESDIADFAAAQDKHPKFIADCDLTFPVHVYEVFLKRVTERNEWAQELAKEKFDFNKESTVFLDPKSTKYCKTTDEAKARWRDWIKYELCNLILDGVKEDEARSRIQKRYRNLLRITSQLDKDDLLEQYLVALTNAFDPHSSYMSPKSLEEFDIAMRLQLQGIGAALVNDDGKTIVKEILPGGAAAEDKRLKVGDQITGVGQGESGEIVDVADMGLSRVVHLIRGAAGTKVRLEVIPVNTDQRAIYLLTRRKVALTERAAKGEIIEAPGGGANAPKLRVGMITVPSFYGGSAPDTGLTSDVRRILGEFKKKGVDAVVMDLRNNGGGLLQEAIGVASLLVDRGPIVQVKDFNGKIRQHDDDFPGVAYDGPLVVLVNRLSASASEIFAGVIQDYERGLVVGDSSTFGKGTVTQVVDLTRLVKTDKPVAEGKFGAIIVTLQGFYRVNGQSTQKRGVVPDVILPSVTDREEFSEAKLDYVLDFDPIRPSRFTPAELVSPRLIAKVRAASEERRAKSEDFAKLKERIERLREFASRKSLTFTEAKLRQYKAERKELAEFAIGDAPGSDPDAKKDRKFGETTYEREVLSIVADLVRLEKQRSAAGGSEVLHQRRFPAMFSSPRPRYSASIECGSGSPGLIVPS
jgi:carboxyl-terminal processing protease